MVTTKDRFMLLWWSDIFQRKQNCQTVEKALSCFNRSGKEF